MAQKSDPGLGGEYEVFMPALIALRLCADESVENFRLESNVKGFGNLDDVLVTIKLLGREQQKFGFQLKHKENDNTLIQPVSFEGDQGQFSIKKYCKGYAEIGDKDSYSYILYTNKGFSPENAKKVRKFLMAEADCQWREFFNTGVGDERFYEFDINEETDEEFYKFKLKNKQEMGTKELYRGFLKKFTLFVSQANSEIMEGKIVDIFKTRYKSDVRVAVNYIDIFRRWHKGEYVNKYLDREMIIVHLMDLLLSPYPMNPVCKNQKRSKRVELLETAIKQFDLTIAETPVNAIGQFWLIENLEENLLVVARNNNFVTRSTKTLDFALEQRVLWYCHHYPIFIDVSNLESIYATLQLCKGINRFSFVLCGSGVDCQKFGQATIFRNLTDLTGDIYNEVVEEFELSLQGRRPIPIKELIVDCLTTSHLFAMLGNFTIGEDQEKLPEYYVPRSVSTTVFSLDAIKNLDGDSIVIVGNSTIQDPSVLVVEQYKEEKFDHLFKFVGQNKLKWLSSKTKIDKLRTCRRSTSFIDESTIYDDFINGINVVCARPGMGKSVMMNYLKNNCPSSFWTVKIVLKEHDLFFKKTRTCVELMDKFLKSTTEDSLENRLKIAFRNTNQIFWFFDGLDELQKNHVKSALNCIKKLSALGHRVWVSSRYNLQELLEDTLDVLPIDIKEFNEVNQKSYIRKRLQASYLPKEIDGIVEKIYGNGWIINNGEILGVPLQLFMITYIFIEDEDREFSDGFFILTKMFHHFFEGKYRHHLNKMKCQLQIIDQDELEDRLENYKVPALKSCLDHDAFTALHLDCDKFLERVRQKGDPLGIILKVHNSAIIFDHNSFGEYFAATWLSENFHKIAEKNFIFNSKYDNVRLMFDMKLAEESPPHLAILYRNVPEFDSDEKDEGGRSLLHIAVSYGPKYPPLRVEISDSGYKIADQYKIDEIKTDDKHEKILTCILDSDPSMVEDDLFGWYPWRFADTAMSLSSLARIKCNLTDLLNYDSFTIIYYSVRFGYADLLKMGVQSDLFRKILNLKNKNVFGRDETLLHVAAENGHKEIVEILVEEGADIGSVDENGLTALLRAAFEGHTDVVQCLKKRGGDVDGPDKDGQTALHLAAFNGHVDTVKYLIKLGAVGVQDKFGQTPLQLATKKNHKEVIDLL